MDDLLATGIVGRPHGTKGYLKVSSLSREVDHFRSLKEIVLVRGAKRMNRAVEDVRPTANGVLLKLKDVETPEQARTYTGCEIWVERELAAPLGEEEYYVADLCGCAIVVGSDVRGEIVGVCEGGNGMLLEIAIGDGTRAFVPFLPVFIGEVDTVHRRVELLEDWVLE